MKRILPLIAVTALGSLACTPPTAPDFPCVGLFDRVAVYDDRGFVGCYRPDALPELVCTAEGCWFER